MLKVTQELTVYEINEKETVYPGKEMVLICSRWNRDSMVVLVVDDTRYTINAEDLKAAIDNATNTNH